MPITLDGTNGITTPTYGGADTSEYVVPVTQFKNKLINSDMRIDQRNAGASVTPANGAYTIDRWRTETSGGGVYTVQQSTTAPAGFTNSMLITVTTADSSIAATDYYDVEQFIEGFNVADLAWGTANAKTVTLSFWVRSSVTGTFAGSLINSANNRAYVFTYTISSANTFEYKTVTISGDTSGTWLTNNGRGIGVYFDLGNGSTYQATAGSWGSAYAVGTTSSVKLISTLNATFYITGVQLEVGSTATSFDYRPYGTELQLCQRYYQLASRYEEWTQANVNNANNANASVLFIQPMRTSPTITLAPAGSSAGNMAFLTTGGSTPSGIGTHTAISITTNGFRITAGSYTASGWAAGVATAIYAYSNPTTVYTASAEL